MESVQVQEIIPACSWLQHRFNVVPHGGNNKLSSKFVDSLEAAQRAKKRLQNQGANLVDIYDTVSGEFLQ